MHETQKWFVFRGQRDYLHSASLFDYIITEFANKAGTPHHIDFIFSHMTKHICSVKMKNEGNAGLVASYIDNNVQIFLYETNIPIENRVVYTEPEEGTKYIISEDGVFIPEITEENSFIELSIAAFKGLLTALFPKFKGKYIFARIQLESIPNSTFFIHYNRKIAKHFFEGEISVRGTAVGFIYFGIS